MSGRDVDLLIADILLAANKILEWSSGQTFEEFAADEKTLDAVARNFEIIGEAAARLPEEFRAQNDDIPWNRIRGFRNRIIHDYFGVDQQIVWMIIKDYLPDLLEKLKKLP